MNITDSFLPKTSANVPQHVDFVPLAPYGLKGRLGITSCPGKKDKKWNRDLDTDLAVLAGHHPDMIVSLLERGEYAALQVSDYPDRAQRRGIRFVRAEIRDLHEPHREGEFQAVVTRIVAALREGQTVLVHCRSGVGRAVLTATCVLIALGVSAAEAFLTVRRYRPIADTTLRQEQYMVTFAHRVSPPAPGPRARSARSGSLRCGGEGDLQGPRVGGHDATGDRGRARSPGQSLRARDGGASPARPDPPRGVPDLCHDGGSAGGVAGGEVNAPLPKPALPAGKIYVSNGLGIDSLAVLVGLERLGLRPEAIYFADTGSEKNPTYTILPALNAWLRKVGFPEVTVLTKTTPDPAALATLRVRGKRLAEALHARALAAGILVEGRVVRFTDDPAVKARVAEAAWQEALRLHPSGVLTAPARVRATSGEDEEESGEDAFAA